MRLSLEVTEIFHSLQGEGPYSGKPAVFLRLSGCIPPLCPWCDTLYACGKGHKMSLGSVFEQIRSFHIDFIVITGGEPFLQWNTGLEALERRLLASGHEVQYETSGKVAIPETCRGFKICSPKYMEGRWHFVEENLSQANLFKFTASDNPEQIQRFVTDRNIPCHKVWIMPLGATREEQLARMPALWKFCVDNGFNLSARLHVLAFDTKRGI